MSTTETACALCGGGIWRTYCASLRILGYSLWFMILLIRISRSNFADLSPFPSTLHATPLSCRARLGQISCQAKEVTAYPDSRRIQEHMIAGASAGSVSTVCTYPLDLARSRLAVIPISRDACHRRSFALVNYIKVWYRIGGIRELYRLIINGSSLRGLL